MHFFDACSAVYPSFLKLDTQSSLTVNLYPPQSEKGGSQNHQQNPASTQVFNIVTKLIKQNGFGWFQDGRTALGFFLPTVPQSYKRDLQDFFDSIYDLVY